MYRPKKLGEFIGQDAVVRQVGMVLNSARKRKTRLPHILISGPSGTGKTTLAGILAEETSSVLKTTTPAALTTNKELFQMFVKAMAGPTPVIFLDEVHRLKVQVAEDLYLPMEDNVFVRKGGQSVEYDLTKWTLIGATTQPGELPEPFINRFGMHLQMQPYTEDEMATLVTQSAAKTGVPITEEAVLDIAMRSRQNPRIANHYLERCFDAATMLGTKAVDGKAVRHAFDVLEVGENGLTANDRKYLQTLFEADRPIGIVSLVPVLHTDAFTIRNSIEPYLVQSGFVSLGSRGRQLTEKGIEYVDTELMGNKRGVKTRR